MEKQIGKVTHYFNRIAVAVLELEEGLKLGDTIHIVGHTTDFTQKVESMEVDHQPMSAVGAGADVALAVDQRVRRGDVVFMVTNDQTYF
jgi:putative protease